MILLLVALLPANDDAVSRFAAWLEGLTPDEYEFVEGRAVRQAGEAAAEFVDSGKDLLAAVRAAFRTARRPHTQVNLVRLASVIETKEAWTFVASKAADRKLDTSVRVEAVRALASGGSPDSAPLLRTFLVDPSWQVRKNAACGLAREGGPQDVRILIASKDPFLRWGAALGLATRSGRASDDLAPLLLEWCVRETDPQVIAWVPAAARNVVSDPRSLVHPFLSALARRDTDAEKAFHVLSAAFDVEPSVVLDVFAACYERGTNDGITIPTGTVPWAAVAGILELAVTPACARAIRCVLDDDRLLACGATLPETSAPNWLHASLKSAAARIVAVRGNVKAAGLLRRELEDGAPAGHAAEIVDLLLALVPTADSAGFLKGLAADAARPAEVRTAALAGYAAASREVGLPVLTAALKDPREKFRERAASLLALSAYCLGRDAEAVRALEAALKTESSAETRRAIQRSLAMLRTVSKEESDRREYAARFFVKLR
ncbi:MAG: HEAT repeat domain-containing protein [Planctomycetes bacterium]|nr:HEAT repeat domain-containing protein [Planctomycetota bacterium]